jgi:Ca2+-binding RTX toxin-like protein
MNTISITANGMGSEDLLLSDTQYVFETGSSLMAFSGYALDAGSVATNRAIVCNGSLAGPAGILVGDQATGGGGGSMTIGVTSIINVYADAIHVVADAETISTHGSVMGNTGIYSIGAATSLANTGWISGKTDGVHMAGGNSIIHNVGEISGVEGVVLGGSALAKNVVINTGTVAGQTMAIEGSDGTDIIRNSGTISGTVDLGWGNDTFDTRGGTVKGTVLGGDGDDHYIVDKAGLAITEVSGGGHDTVTSSVSTLLGDYVEDLVLTGSKALTGTGNALGNFMKGNAGISVLYGGDGKDRLDGGHGDDFLTGGKNADTFVFNRHSGHDEIIDFKATGAGHDRIDLKQMSGFDSFADISAHAVQHGKNVIVNFGHGDVLTLYHFDVHDLSNADFMF